VELFKCSFLINVKDSVVVIVVCHFFASLIMMQSLDKGDQLARVKRATKSDCKQPCAEINDLYQKEDLKNDVKRAFDSRNSYSHGTVVTRTFCVIQHLNVTFNFCIGASFAGHYLLSKCLYTRPAVCIDSAGICTRPII